MIELVLLPLYGGVLYISVFVILTLLEADTITEEVEWRDEWPSLSVVIPSYNEEDCIEMTVESVLESEYPDKEVIVVDDGSEDRTGELAESYDGVEVIHQENQGKGAALNTGLEAAEGELVACVDADSQLTENSLKNIVSEMDEDAAGIACAMKVKEPSKAIEHLQHVEYLVGVLTRNIFGMMDAIHITPGPLAVYRREKLEEYGGFDEESLVEDQEICWRMQEEHEKIQHSRHGESYTEAPKSLKGFYRQRKRWWTGSFEEMLNYRHMILNPDYGDLGMFVAPAKLGQAGMSMVGLTLLIYLTLNPIYASFKNIAEVGPEAIDFFAFGTLTADKVFNYVYWLVFGNNFVLISALGALFVLSVSLIYMALVHTDESVTDLDLVPTTIYVFWFFAISGFLSMVSLYHVATGRGIEW